MIRFTHRRIVLRCAAVLLTAGAVSASARADLRREVEPNDPAASAQPVMAAASLGGTIGAPGDVDIYAVALNAGQALKADVLARGFRADNKAGSELSALLEILDIDGVTVLASAQSLGEFDDPMTSFAVPVDGRYYVSVRDLSPAEGGADYLYVLSIEIDANPSRSGSSRGTVSSPLWSRPISSRSSSSGAKSADGRASAAGSTRSARSARTRATRSRPASAVIERAGSRTTLDPRRH